MSLGREFRGIANPALIPMSSAKIVAQKELQEKDELANARGDRAKIIAQKELQEKGSIH